MTRGNKSYHIPIGAAVCVSLVLGALATVAIAQEEEQETGGTNDYEHPIVFVAPPPELGGEDRPDHPEHAITRGVPQLEEDQLHVPMSDFGDLSCFQGRALCPGSVSAMCDPIHSGGRSFAQMVVNAAMAPRQPDVEHYNQYNAGGGQISDGKNALYLFRSTVWDDNESGLGGFEARWKLWVIPRFVGEPVEISSDFFGQLEGREPAGTRVLQLHGPFTASGCEWGDTGSAGLKPQDVRYQNFILWDWDWTVGGRVPDAISVFLYESDESINPDDWVVFMTLTRLPSRLSLLTFSDESVNPDILGMLANWPVDDDGGSTDVELTFGTPNTPPNAVLDAPVSVECSLPSGSARVELDAGRTVDVDEDVLQYEFFTFEGSYLARGPDTKVVTILPLGATFILLNADDAFGGRGIDARTVHVVDTIPPAVIAPPDIFFECTSPQGEEIEIGEAVVTDQCTGNLRASANPPTHFPLGVTVIVHEAVDVGGNSGQDIQLVSISDSTPPSLSVELDVDLLFPPNGKMVDVHATIEVSDACDDEPMVRLASIEAFDKQADGSLTLVDSSDDYVIRGTDASLRARKGARGTGRVYLLTYEAMDTSGNIAVSVRAVEVKPNIGSLNASRRGKGRR